MLEVNNLSKRYNDNLVLDNISFSIKKGDIVSVVGPSGSGKSTLLRCIDLLEKSEGEILFEGKKLYKGEIGKKIGMVFQQFNLFPHLSVLDNIILAPTKLKLMAKKDATKKAYELLDTIDLKDKANSYPNELSGGQKQRLSITRGVIANPKILILDDSTSAVDSETELRIRNNLNCLLKDTTVLIITQRINTMQSADRVIVLEDGEVEAIGTPDELMATSRIYQEIYNSQQILN